MNRTNTQTKTTTTPISDCTCKAKATRPRTPVWQKVSKEPRPTPTAEEPLFKRYDFNNMPGVALIVPDLTSPTDLIRFASGVVEEISLMVLNRTAKALLAAHDIDMAEMAKDRLDQGETRCAKPTLAPEAKPADFPWRSVPTIREVIDIHTSANDFLHRWMKDNAPTEVYSLFDHAGNLWCAELGYYQEGKIPPEGFDARDIIGAVSAAKAGLCKLDPDFEVDDE